jgi:hypothetical protein
MYRDFDTMLEGLRERPTFRLAGQTFTCRAPAKMSWDRWFQLMLGVTESGGFTEERKRTEDFVRAVLVPKDRQRFTDLLTVAADDEDEDDAVEVVTNEQVGALVSWVLEVYSGKDKKSANGSSPSPDTTGQPSNVVSLSSRNA